MKEVEKQGQNTKTSMNESLTSETIQIKKKKKFRKNGLGRATGEKLAPR